MKIYIVYTKHLMLLGETDIVYRSICIASLLLLPNVI